MTLALEDLSAIFDAYADAIEGGNSYRGSGTAYPGAPGVRSRFQRLLPGGEVGTLTANQATPSTTSITISSAPTMAADEFDKDNTPPFFLVCQTLGANATAASSQNAGVARKISAYAVATTTFTTAAFLSNVDDNDTFTVAEGFKRIPNGQDIEDSAFNAGAGFDRLFHFRASAGKRLEWYGDGNHYYETVMTARLRLNKFKRAHYDADSLLQNMAIIKTYLSNSAYRPSSVRALLPGDSAEVEEDSEKMIVTEPMRLIYKINATIR